LLLITRSTFGVIGVVLNFFVIDRMVLSDADILNKLSPFFTIILCAIFLKEYVRRYQVISIIIAFAGAIFIIKPSMSRDRKSTRLNSSHVSISYAVFCLKKKK